VVPKGAFDKGQRESGRPSKLHGGFPSMTMRVSMAQGSSRRLFTMGAHNPKELSINPSGKFVIHSALLKSNFIVT